MTAATLLPVPRSNLAPGAPCPECGAVDLHVSGDALTVGRLAGPLRCVHPASCACGWRGEITAAGCNERHADDLIAGPSALVAAPPALTASL